MQDSADIFLTAFSKSIADATFVKATLSNYKGLEEHLQKVFIRPLDTKKGRRISFQYRYTGRDLVKNYDAGEAAFRLAGFLDSEFRSAHLFTTTGDLQLAIGKRNARLTRSKPSFAAEPETNHDRSTHSLIDVSAYYLKALGITTEAQGSGKAAVRRDQRDKWKQINKFVEVVDGLFRNSKLSANDDPKKEITIVDMGSGKGYLTFALYEHFANKLGLKVKMTGIEARENLAVLGNEIAAASGFDGLRFVAGTIAEANTDGVDILIALHACDTATDDALYKGIASGASVIVAAPCCHKEVKRQLRPPDLLSGILKHPVMAERTAETLTDGIRSMLLEANGYRTKMFEFVATEHTPKNNLIVATKRADGRTGTTADDVRSVMDEFRIEHQHLVELLER